MGRGAGREVSFVTVDARSRVRSDESPPPQPSGNFFEKDGYRGPWQSGKPAEIERTMRAVENALLLKGDDAQLLVCARFPEQRVAERTTQLVEHGRAPEEPL